MPERPMFTFKTTSDRGVSVRCHECGWTAKGRLGKTVFPKADEHSPVCPVVHPEAARA